MTLDDIDNISVIGAGNMGHQIAILCAMNGFKVTCTDISQEMLNNAAEFADTYLTGRVEKGRITDGEAVKIRENLDFIADFKLAVTGADYIIEAAIEDLEVKRNLFADLDKYAPAHAILATNSSTIVSSKIADVTDRPDKVVNMHFFNPALVMKLVEVVQGSHVSDETANLTIALTEKLGKHPVHLKKEVEGFLLNRIFMAISREAQWLLEMGVATVEDIDMACVHGAGHPMGPFRLNDFTGLDLSYKIAMERFQASGDKQDLPLPTLSRHIAKGEFGKKTGKGWYDYEKSDK